jgi:hypothetical protein
MGLWTACCVSEFSFAPIGPHVILYSLCTLQRIFMEVTVCELNTYLWKATRQEDGNLGIRKRKRRKITNKCSRAL